MLLRAFALANRVRPLRLILLGEGRGRSELQRLASTLGIADRVLLPGFQSNPYQWIRHCDLFVLSSRWEGSPNVLTEALALGIPVVSTDCPSGPNEILQQGRFGRLVAVGDQRAMAGAILKTLKSPLPAEELVRSVEEYRQGTSAAAYLRELESC